MIPRLALLIAGLFHLCLAQSFEVASIKASQFQSGDGEGSLRESIEIAGDKLTMRNITLRSCIGWTYGVQEFQIIGAFGPERFDILAKAAAPSPMPAMREMLGALLQDRFKLKFHRDTKELPHFELVVAKGGPKLNLSHEDGPGVLRPSKISMVAQHASMLEFAATLTGPLRTPVIDKTGLTGRYDFTVDLASEYAAVKPGDQVDIVSMVMSAIRQQFGLNLESRKGPIEILVIDQVEKSPSGN